MRWLWHQWDHKEKPWSSLLKINDPIDRQLFFSSTSIQIGNGKASPFWESRWLFGFAPKELVPSLYDVARFKKRSIQTEMKNNNWIRNLQHISTSNLLEEFTLLFMALAEVNLTDQNDTIHWKWTANDKFTVASAYKCQFNGFITSFPASDIWSSFTDHKNKFFACLVMQNKFFACLVMHNKILTADNMLKK
jgi:hypothetical protein